MIADDIGAEKDSTEKGDVAEWVQCEDQLEWELGQVDNCLSADPFINW
jgi:hypothetical protein